MKIKEIHGDATCPLGGGKKIIAHICNDKGRWGRGFVLAVSKKWKEPEMAYREWYRGEDFALGKIQVVATKQKDIFVANMVAQKGFGGVAVRYEELRKCLKELKEVSEREKATVHMPRIGAGLGGGDFEVIRKIIEEELTDKGIEVTIYNL